jgi:diguanylate cyclase (GGDEF)-like protein/PAS domain S-box-containing protein
MKVLIAEDNEDSRNLLVKQLQVHGHEVIAVANGAEALERALKEKPDILVTDILMPHMDGFMLCRLWKQIEQLRHIPFVFYTAIYTSDEDRQFALSLGANAFISKPTDPEKLVQVLLDLFEKAKAGLPSPAEVAPLEPSLYFAEYSKRLSTMLDKKVAQLEREVTERKRAEDTLRESEEKYRDLFEYAGDALFIMDDRFRFLECNNHTLKLFGCKSREQIIGKTPDIVSPEIQPDGQISYEKARRLTLLVMEGKPQRFEWKHHRLDNKKPFWVSVSLSRIKIKDKYFMQAVVQDITERKRAEERIEHLNTVLHAIRKVNQLITREKESKRLIKGACDELVKTRGYSNAWIALLDEFGSFVTTAEAGLGKNFKPMVEMLKRGELPRSVRNALEQSGVVIIEDPLSTCTDCPLAKMCGDCGAVTARLEHEGRVYGLGSVSMPRGLTADEEEQTLFREVCGDIAFALHSIELEAERKRAEEELRESGERYRTVFNTAPASIILIDSEGQMVDVSPYHINSIGRGKITKEDLVGKNIITHPTIVNAGLSETYKRVLEGEPFDIKDVYFPTLIAGGDGYFNVKGMPLFQDEEVIGAVITHEDITERKRAEEALSRSEEEKSLILSSLTELVAYEDKQLRVIWANQAAAESVGLSVEQLVGRHCYEIWGRRTEPCIGCPVTKAIKTGRIQEAEMTTPDGRVWGIRGYPAKDENGDVMGVVEVTIEITERKRAEEERESAARRVEALRDVAQAVNRSLELDELLNESLATVLDVIESDVGGIYLLDLQSGEFTLKAHIGVSEDTVASIGLIKLKGKEIKQVLEWQEPVLAPFSLSTGANAARIAAAIKKGGMRAHITVPIRSRGTLIGALLLANHGEREFRTNEVELLRDIGNELAVGIENAMLLQRTKELSLTDELTGLYNRRHFYHMLEPEMYRTLRKGRSFCLVMLDLDGFKEYNDRMGHASGDSVLQSFSQTVESSLRKSDTAFRYGGDEFIIILPETDAKRARQIMDRMRARWLRLVEAQYAPLETPLGFSTGIAQFPENADTADGLVFLADSALYYAKKEGGGRDVLVSSLSAIPPEILGTATLDQVYALAATVDARDPYTYGHSGRVAGIAQKIGKARGLSEKELANLYAASLLHDVGKVGVPDAILTKPGALTAEEWVAIKKHSAEGARIVGYVRGLGALVPVILHHHEWYDGTGYPDGLKGEDIPLAARIISVADAYDTMTTARPYREVVSHQEASEELRRCSGTQFDPDLVEAFCRAMNGDSGHGRKRKPASE